MKDTLSGVTAVVVAFLLVCCSSSEEAPTYEVSHPCPEGEVLVHRVSPDLNPKIVEGIVAATDEWSAIIGPKHPMKVVVTNEASEENIACIVSWVYNDEALPTSAFAVTEAGKVHLTRSALPASIMLQLPLHEMGHVLGLGDSKVKDSVMWKFIGPGQPITCQDKKDVCKLQSCIAGC